MHRCYSTYFLGKGLNMRREREALKTKVQGNPRSHHFTTQTNPHDLQRLTTCMTHKGARPTSYMDGDELNVRYRVTWRVCAYFNVHAAVTWNGSMEKRATGVEITT